MTATPMDALRVRGTTPGRIAVSSLMLILGSRLALFAMFQMLIAGGLTAAGVAAPWHRSAGWWPIAAALSNILSLAILWSFTRAEGLPLHVVFGWNGGGMKRDLPLLVGVLLLMGPPRSSRISSWRMHSSATRATRWLCWYSRFRCGPP